MLKSVTLLLLLLLTEVSRYRAGCWIVCFRLHFSSSTAACLSNWSQMGFDGPDRWSVCHPRSSVASPR